MMTEIRPFLHCVAHIRYKFVANILSIYKIVRYEFTMVLV
jgi:hypothetical protein